MTRKTMDAACFFIRYNRKTSVFVYRESVMSRRGRRGAWLLFDKCLLRLHLRFVSIYFRLTT